MASILGDGTGPGGPGSTRCLLLLQRSLAIQLSRGPPPMILATSQHETIKEHPADEMWMYDKGYNLFQVMLVHAGEPSLLAGLKTARRVCIKIREASPLGHPGIPFTYLYQATVNY
ncbi:hypothetical protein KQX54_007501 [Cotesia glomerata]|uniref:Uncharacterized protein n=1 Tax=Cotesia glomerata TaxID=32391 RepID=A0AAV7J7G2_COTGL|nr:hypothetical protein KQX54_007501 [Cotesia glomerata]